MKIKIKQETILKFLNCLNELNQVVISGDLPPYWYTVIPEKHKVPYNIFYTAVKLGYFQKLGRGNYKALLKSIEPIHARKVLEDINKTANEHQQNKINKKGIKPSKELINMPVSESFQTFQLSPTHETKRTPVVKPVKKTFSILWGLFKWTY